MEVFLKDYERLVSDQIDAGHFELAVKYIIESVLATYQLDVLDNKYLYYPNLDKQVSALSSILFERYPPNRNIPGCPVNVILASEVYPIGGHTRVLLDVASILPNTLVILTDVYFRLRSNMAAFDWFRAEHPELPLVVLSGSGYWEKCQELKSIMTILSPRSLIYLQHHQDAIAFIATLGLQECKKVLIHHCDHNPSLGATLLFDYHLDYTEKVRQACNSSTPMNCRLIPLSVEDQGLKSFSSPCHASYSVVTSGVDNKFLFSGPLSYPQILGKILDETAGKMYHIGNLTEPHLEIVKSVLEQHGINASRFVYVGPVKSVWHALHQIDAHIYFGSAPFGGGRSSAEAQGSGYPIIYYKDNASDRFATGSCEIYSNEAMAWTNLDEIPELLRISIRNFESKSLCSRQFYQEHLSRSVFRNLWAELGLL